jgi:hypothetical protein
MQAQGSKLKAKTGIIPSYETSQGQSFFFD